MSRLEHKHTEIYGPCAGSSTHIQNTFRVLVLGTEAELPIKGEKEDMVHDIFTGISHIHPGEKTVAASHTKPLLFALQDVSR